MRTCKATDSMHIGELEQRLANIRMGEHEAAMELCNRARKFLAKLRMAGVDYSTANYTTHIVKGLPTGYNLMRWIMVMHALTRNSTKTP
ncbi:unnamed protein product [Closterium sp. NIES-54]